jgi:hypothetical protein
MLLHKNAFKQPRQLRSFITNPPKTLKLLTKQWIAKEFFSQQFYIFEKERNTSEKLNWIENIWEIYQLQNALKLNWFWKYRKNSSKELWMFVALLCFKINLKIWYYAFISYCLFYKKKNTFKDYFTTLGSGV